MNKCIIRYDDLRRCDDPVFVNEGILRTTF